MWCVIFVAVVLIVLYKRTEKNITKIGESADNVPTFSELSVSDQSKVIADLMLKENKE